MIPTVPRKNRCSSRPASDISYRHVGQAPACLPVQPCVVSQYHRNAHNDEHEVKKASGGRQSPGHCGWIDLLLALLFSIVNRTACRKK